MNSRRRNNLRVVRPDMDEEDAKRKKRRRILWITIIIVAAVVVVLLIVFFFLVRNLTYDDYNVTTEVERVDTSATHYIAYGDGYVKYSNDGAAYITADNVTEWNQSYEMENPMVAVCEPYIVFTDREGETVYVLNEEGYQGEISTIQPISRIDVASQGTVALLTTDSETGYLALYDKTGGQIAEGAIHLENTGSVMDIALSSDGENLAASIVDVSTGKARTTINFYNFSTAGKNAIDNLVGRFQFAGTIVPEITYFGNSTMLAFADTGVYVFEGSSSPQETGWLEAEDEIQSVFYDDSYFGLVYSDVTGETGRMIYVYDTNCKERTAIEANISYDSIGFLDNHEICMYNSDQCEIYTLSGTLKFTGQFDDKVDAIFHRSGQLNYLLLTGEETQRIRLKIFGGISGFRRTNTEEPVYETTEETETVTEMEGSAEETETVTEIEGTVIPDAEGEEIIVNEESETETPDTENAADSGNTEETE